MNYIAKTATFLGAGVGAVLTATAVAPVAAMAAPSAGLTPVAGSATPATAGNISAAAVSRKSFKCTSPAGQNLNISWGPGTVSITVYFNNHCSQQRHIKLAFAQATDVCFTVNAKTKGSKKVYTTGGVLQGITSPSSC